MDTSILLVFEVVGLLLLAGALTGVLIWGDLNGSRDRSTPLALPVTVFCPRTMGPAAIRLGALVRGDRTAMSVLECEVFRGEILCDQECLEPAVLM